MILRSANEASSCNIEKIIVGTGLLNEWYKENILHFKICQSDSNNAYLQRQVSQFLYFASTYS